MARASEYAAATSLTSNSNIPKLHTSVNSFPGTAYNILSLLFIESDFHLYIPFTLFCSPLLGGYISTTPVSAHYSPTSLTDH